MKLMMRIDIYHRWCFVICPLFLSLVATSFWIMTASRRLSGIKINCGSQLFEFMGSAALIKNFSNLMRRLESTWESIPSHLKSWTMLFVNFTSRRSSPIKTSDGLVSPKLSKPKSVILLTKSKVWPSVWSCHASLTRKIHIFWAFMTTTWRDWWLTFHTIHCLPMVSTYWIIHLACCLPVKTKCILGMVRETMIMMSTWIDTNIYLWNLNLFLITMNISVSLVHSLRYVARTYIHLPITHW